MKKYELKGKKTNSTQIVTEEQFEILKKKKLDKNFTIVSVIDEDKAPSFPKIESFKNTDISKVTKITKTTKTTKTDD